MRAIIVFREKSDYAREVFTFLDDFRRRTGKKIEIVDPDTRDGEGFCQVYNIVEYPTILGLDSSGKVLASWRGLPLPRIDSVSYYAEG